MRFSTQIKPISYVKAHAAELLDRIEEEREPIIITQNGEARAVLVDIHSFEQSQETIALLKILAMGKKEVEEGRTYTVDEVTRSIRKRMRNAKVSPRRSAQVEPESA
ncbi:MAG TPA: type II toxin-antitoxin system prevent-host-death family antitoxin [Terracidiphilus sp.]|nr:type II toxin-antitoxin system prevent-host-death family antitoxin [Terracidiphilus sp.]